MSSQEEISASVYPWKMKIDEIVSFHDLAKSKGDSITQIFTIFLACAFLGCMSLKEINSSLLQSSAVGDTTRIKEMLERGADINTKDRYGRTPLHVSLENKQVETAKFLMNRGANVNAKDALDNTPLHLSEYADEERTSHLLTERGADRTAPNKFGLQPAEMRGVPEIEAKIVEAAQLLGPKGEWIEASRARMLYDGLRALEARYLINAIVLQVIRGSASMHEKGLTGPGVKLLPDRRQEEVRTQHILVSMKPSASPEDTLKAYMKAVDIIRRARAGENFDSLVIQNSDDPAARENRGDDYYFTSGQLVTPFEDAAYSMRKGEITPAPVRTVFGYFIIKLTDRKPNPGSIKVRHIMTRLQVPNTDSVDTATALVRIRALQDSLKKGCEFSNLARKCSEDNGSAGNGGDLGWFERRRWVKPFDEAAFTLKPGEISDIVQTPYGFHIIKCDGLRPLSEALPTDDYRYSFNRLQILILAIKLGVEDSEEKLASLLMVFGDKPMAEDYLNCGSFALGSAARQWAYANGYTIMTGPGSHRATWGRF